MDAGLNEKEEGMRNWIKAMAGVGLAVAGFPIWAQTATVVPVLLCMEYKADINGVTAYFGHINTSAEVVSVPFGQNNFFFPAPPFRGQPTLFDPGTYRKTISVTFPAASYVEWTLNGIKVKAVLSDTSIPGCAAPVEPRALTAVVTGAGSGTVTGAGLDCTHVGGLETTTCVADQDPRTPATLSATPAPGSAFAGWGDACAGTDPGCTLTVNTAKVATARFASLGNVKHILIDPATPSTLYSALDGAGVFKKTAGTDWTASNNGLANLDVGALAIRSDGGALYAGTDGSGIFGTADGGAQWSACAVQPDNLHIRALAFSGATLYAGTAGGVFASADGCASWTALNAGLPN